MPSLPLLVFLFLVSRESRGLECCPTALLLGIQVPCLCERQHVFSMVGFKLVCPFFVCKVCRLGAYMAINISDVIFLYIKPQSKTKWPYL
uniref:Putative secreted protein n=1 Tax=Ixodes ricinus TaxID=34613 RepID=A0A147BAF7_IXORI